MCSAGEGAGLHRARGAGRLALLRARGRPQCRGRAAGTRVLQGGQAFEAPRPWWPPEPRPALEHAPLSPRPRPAHALIILAGMLPRERSASLGVLAPHVVPTPCSSAVLNKHVHAVFTSALHKFPSSSAVYPPSLQAGLCSASRCATRPLRAQGTGAARTRGHTLAGGATRIRGASGSE